MLPEALQASLNILLLKFLLSAAPGSHSELAANIFYYLRPFTQERKSNLHPSQAHVCMQFKKIKPEKLGGLTGALSSRRDL